MLKFMLWLTVLNVDVLTKIQLILHNWKVAPMAKKTIGGKDAENSPTKSFAYYAQGLLLLFRS